MSEPRIDIDLLTRVCKTPGAPGYEQRIREDIIEIVTPYVDIVDVDAMGNVHAIKKSANSGAKKVLVAAHMDEISFITTHIDDDGYVRFHPLGGFDPKTLTAQRVIIHGKEDVLDVMGTKPIHIMKPEERKKMPEISDFYIRHEERRGRKIDRNRKPYYQRKRLMYYGPMC